MRTTTGRYGDHATLLRMPLAPWNQQRVQEAVYAVVLLHSVVPMLYILYCILWRFLKIVGGYEKQLLATGKQVARHYPDEKEESGRLKSVEQSCPSMIRHIKLTSS